MGTLFIDCATSGRFSIDDKDPASPTQAHLVRLSALLIGDDGHTVSEACYLVRIPDAVAVEPGAQSFHGISKALLGERGHTWKSVSTDFGYALADAQIIVAFGWQFQRHVLEWTYRYYGHPGERVWPESYDALINSAEMVGISVNKPSAKPQYKWPTWDQMHQKVRGRPWQLTGDPVIDGIQRVRIVKQCYDQIGRSERY